MTQRNIVKLLLIAAFGIVFATATLDARGSIQPAASRERTYMGYKVIELKFPIAGGETVSLPMTDGGPVPAENRDFRIEAAGLTVQPSLFDPKQALLAWGFAFSGKTSKKLERVVVEEVYPSDPAKVVVDDLSPAISGEKWSGSTIGVEPNPASTTWLFTEEPSVFVFRFTITPEGKRPVVLYQPATFSRSAKEKVRQVIASRNGG